MFIWRGFQIKAGTASAAVCPCFLSIHQTCTFPTLSSTFSVSPSCCCGLKWGKSTLSPCWQAREPQEWRKKRQSCQTCDANTGQKRAIAAHVWRAAESELHVRVVACGARPQTQRGTMCSQPGGSGVNLLAAIKAVGRHSPIQACTRTVSWVRRTTLCFFPLDLQKQKGPNKKNTFF